MNQNPLFPAAILFLCLALPVVPARAAPMVFTVDSTQSQISLSGLIANYPMTSQSAGSLTTTYSGNLNATVSGSTIQFTGSSMITAKPMAFGSQPWVVDRAVRWRITARKLPFHS